MTVEQFYTHYARLSMGDDDRALAAVYAPSFFVAGPTGSKTFANDQQFLDWLAQLRAFNRRHGIRLVAHSGARTLLSPLHVLAQVHWSARFEKTGARAIEFEIAYLMELAGQSWRLLGYVSASDQEEEMRAHGACAGQGTTRSVAVVLSPPSAVALIVTRPRYVVVPRLNVAVAMAFSASVTALKEPIAPFVLVLAE
jgi:hypothetical protein